MKMNIDFSQVNRIFAFGCSFTHYIYPTWADLIAMQYPDKLYYNFGKAGMGNLAISCRIIEASKRYQFNDNDLIMVMWSTFSRDDRWLNGSWYAQGNVYNSEYPDIFVRDFNDPVGHIIRDQAIIELTKKYLNNFNTLILKSIPLTYNEEPNYCQTGDVTLTEACALYNSYNELPLDLYSFMGKSWVDKTYYDKNNKKIEKIDAHPYSSTYADYLTHVGIKLDDAIIKFAHDADHIINGANSREDVLHKFKFLDEEIRNQKQFIRLF